MKVLLVDDEESIREVMQEFLVCLGHKVVQAENGVQAFGLFEAAKGTFELVVTDLRMPKLDGIELIRLIRKRDEVIPIILFSGYGLSEANTMIEGLNIVSLEKPIKFHVFELYLKQFLLRS